MIIVINSPGSEDYDGYVPEKKILPYSAAVIVGVLRKNHFKTKLIDLRQKVHVLDKDISFKSCKKWISGEVKDKKISDFLYKCFSHLPSLNDVKLIGFSALSEMNLKYTLLIAKELKTRYPHIITCIGGPAITLSDSTIPKYIDFVVKGNGGKPIIHIANHVINNDKLDLNFKGIHTKEQVTTNQIQNYEVAEEESFPDYSDLNVEEYKNLYKTKSWDKGKEVVYIHYRTALGCPNACTFCNYRSLDKLSFKSVEKVIAELKELKKLYGDIIFRFTESTFNSNPKHYEKLLDEIIDQKLNITWWAFVSMRGMTLDLLRKMAKAGCKSVFWGVEHFSDRMLKIYGKGYKSDNIYKMISYASELGITSAVAQIANGPQETLNDLDIMKQNIFKLSKYKNVYVVINTFQLLKDSIIYKNPKRFGINVLSSFDTNMNNIIKWKEINTNDEDFQDKMKNNLTLVNKLKIFVNFNTRLKFHGIVVPTYSLWHFAQVWYFARTIKSKIFQKS